MALTAGSPWIIFVNFSSTSKWFVLIIILFYSIDTDIFNYSMTSAFPLEIQLFKRGVGVGTPFIG
jgi:hypothetical protein